MNEGLETLQKNFAWELVSLPKEGKQSDVDGCSPSNLEYREALIDKKRGYIQKGYTQRYGVDCQEIFALVAKLHIIHIFISIAANWKWRLQQFDVKNAFLIAITKFVLGI